jgi:hypothetical protein
VLLSNAEMIRYLFYREIGFFSGRTIQNIEIAKRTLAISEPNTNKEIISSHKGPINSIHVDPAEGK